MTSVGFFGTPSLSASVLRDLLEASDIEVAFVVTNPDKAVGRSEVLLATPVKELALLHEIPVFTPTRIRDNSELFTSLRSFEVDYFIVVAYGRILPQEILDIPKQFTINIHGSILPKYRGASPIQSALLHGETETGVTIMKMSLGMDEGDILKIRHIPIDPRETSETLFEKFASVSGPTLIATLRELQTGGITSLPQNHVEATYCTKIEKEDGLVDWSLSAREIYHRWQAYTPWPGIYTIYEGKRLLLEKVSILRHSEQSEESILLEPVSFVPQDDVKGGQVIKLGDSTIGVQCGEGILTLEQVKLEGKKSQSIWDFVNGNRNFLDYRF